MFSVGDPFRIWKRGQSKVDLPQLLGTQTHECHFAIANPSAKLPFLFANSALTKHGSACAHVWRISGLTKAGSGDMSCSQLKMRAPSFWHPMYSFCRRYASHLNDLQQSQLLSFPAHALAMGESAETDTKILMVAMYRFTTLRLNKGRRRLS